LFTEMAMGTIQYFSGGIPRLINSICDMALVYGFADEKPVIDEELVFRVVSDRQLSGIAPFMQPLPVDDPAVLAEIMKLTNTAPEPGGAPTPAVVAPAPAAVAPTPAVVAPAPAVVARAAAATPERKIVPVTAIPSNETVEVSVAPQEISPPRIVEPIKAPMTATRDVPVKEAGRANPYFFREAGDEVVPAEDDEELLLTIEVNDSLANAHHVVPAAQGATVHAAPNGGKEPYLGPAPISHSDSESVDHAPNQTHVVEESSNAIVDPMPWPSISERRVVAPIPAKEHGTGTPPRRSWWRRSIGHNS
jgi:hypothetical protein